MQSAIGTRHDITHIDGGTMRRTKVRSLWQTISLDELAEQQGITAIQNLEEISELWPVDDDPDEFLRFILNERQARRRALRRRV